MRIVTLGSPYTFSGLATKQYDPKAEVLHMETISDVFDELQNSEVDLAVVPIENTRGGSVAETMEALFNSDYKIQAAIRLPIHHFLVGSDDLNRIYSHPQALKQCRKFLKKSYPNAKLVPVSSTVEALKLVDAESAAICSKQAAEAHEMKIVESNIEDDSSNSTRFVVIGKGRIDSVDHSVLSIAFSFSADSPGSLYEVLGEFAKRNINMTKIESHHNPDAPGGYVFYVDFEQAGQSEEIKRIFSSIEKQVAKLKILGGYS